MQCFYSIDVLIRERDFANRSFSWGMSVLVAQAFLKNFKFKMSFKKTKMNHHFNEDDVLHIVSCHYFLTIAAPLWTQSYQWLSRRIVLLSCPAALCVWDSTHSSFARTRFLCDSGVATSYPDIRFILNVIISDWNLTNPYLLTKNASRSFPRSYCVVTSLKLLPFADRLMLRVPKPVPNVLLQYLNTTLSIWFQIFCRS